MCQKIEIAIFSYFSIHVFLGYFYTIPSFLFQIVPHKFKPGLSVVLLAYRVWAAREGRDYSVAGLCA